MAFHYAGGGMVKRLRRVRDSGQDRFLILSDNPLVPEQLRGEDVLEDLQLTLWPLDVIEKALPAGWTIAEAGRRRTLRLLDQPVLVIDYSGEPRWSGKIELTNLRYRYRLTIQSVSSTP